MLRLLDQDDPGHAYAFPALAPQDRDSGPHHDRAWGGRAPLRRRSGRAGVGVEVVHLATDADVVPLPWTRSASAAPRDGYGRRVTDAVDKHVYLPPGTDRLPPRPGPPRRAAGGRRREAAGQRRRRRSPPRCGSRTSTHRSRRWSAPGTVTRQRSPQPCDRPSSSTQVRRGRASPAGGVGRRPGRRLANVAVLRRPAGCPTSGLRRWMVEHTPIAIRTQATSGCVPPARHRRAVTAAHHLVDARSWRSCSRAPGSPSHMHAFYGSGGDDAELGRRIPRADGERVRGQRRPRPGPGADQHGTSTWLGRPAVREAAAADVDHACRRTRRARRSARALTRRTREVINIVPTVYSPTVYSFLMTSR